MCDIMLAGWVNSRTREDQISTKPGSDDVKGLQTHGWFCVNWTKKGVSKSFGSSVVLDEVEPRSTKQKLAIIGPFQIGKSTILMGYCWITSTECWKAGTRRQGLIEDAPDPDRCRCFSKQFYLTLTVEENVAAFTLSAPTCRDRCTRSGKCQIRDAGLGVGDATCWIAPGGMRKRVLC